MLPVRPDHDTILVVAVVGRAEPHRAFLVVDVARLAQPFYGCLDLTLRRELGLPEVDVERHAEPVEGRPRSTAAPAPPLRPACGGIARGRAGRRARPLGLEDVPGEVLDVRAVVAVLGDLRLSAHELQEPRLDRGAEPVHLAAGIVEVVLPLDGPPGGLEQPGEGVADRGVPRVSDRERPGRVRAHELHLHPAAVRLGPAVARPSAITSAGRRAANRRS